MAEVRAEVRTRVLNAGAAEQGGQGGRCVLIVRTVNDEEKTAEFISNVVRIHIVIEEVERE